MKVGLINGADIERVLEISDRLHGFPHSVGVSLSRTGETVISTKIYSSYESPECEEINKEFLQADVKPRICITYI